MPGQSKPTPIKRIDKGGLLTFILVALLAVAFMAKVLLQHQIRDLEAVYYDRLAQHSELREAWGQMMLESAHLTAPLLVEQQARSQLNMRKPQERHYLVLTEENQP